MALFLCFLSAPSIQAQRNYIDIPNYILCINSYAESTPWSTRMISTISEYVQKAPPNWLRMPNTWTRDEYRKLWGDIPIVLCSEEAFQGPHEAYLQKQAIKLKDRTPIAQFSKPYNMAFLHSELLITLHYSAKDFPLPCVPQIHIFYTNHSRFGN